MVDADGRGHPKRIGRGWAPAWSPNGRRIAFTDDVSRSIWTIFLADADGTGRRRLPVPAGGALRIRNDMPDWSPDEQRIAFTRYVEPTRRFVESDIFVAGVDGPFLRRVTRSGVAHSPTWSPDGRRIAYIGPTGLSGVSQQLHIVDADGTGDRTLESASRISPNSVAHVAVSTPEWSPDGRRIAFARGVAGSPASEIFVINVDGTNLRRLTRHAAPCEATRRCPLNNAGPTWSPDSKRIAFLAVPNQLQVINADGSGLHTVIRSSGLFLLGGPDWRS